MVTTQDNLQEAFAGESQANRKYTAYAQKAEQDGYPVIAKLFRAAAAVSGMAVGGGFELMLSAFILGRLDTREVGDLALPQQE